MQMNFFPRAHSQKSSYSMTNRIDVWIKWWQKNNQMYARNENSTVTSFLALWNRIYSSFFFQSFPLSFGISEKKYITLQFKPMLSPHEMWNRNVKQRSWRTKIWRKKHESNCTFFLCAQVEWDDQSIDIGWHWQRPNTFRDIILSQMVLMRTRRERTHNVFFMSIDELMYLKMIMEYFAFWIEITFWLWNKLWLFRFVVVCLPRTHSFSLYELRTGKCKYTYYMNEKRVCGSSTHHSNALLNVSSEQDCERVHAIIITIRH